MIRESQPAAVRRPLDPARWQEVKDALARALEHPADGRTEFLRELCGGDTVVYREAAELLGQNTGALDACADSLALPGAESADPNVGRRVGAWTLGECLGAGGMGTVYLARRADGAFEQRAAVKLLRRGTDTDEVLRRFRAERQILARLDGPGIVRLLDGGETDDGLPFFALELVDGRPVTVHARELSLEDRLRLFLKICAPVQYAHERLIVHRDLKPGNILVTTGGEVKLLDFGIAKLLEPGDLDTEHTLTGQGRLTPAYASPEQARGEPVTTASDVYALGALLYELLAGRSPHRFVTTRPPPAEIARVVGEEPAVRPSLAAEDPAVRRALSGDLDNILLKALEKDPARRYPTVNALAEDVRRHLDGRPVRARRATWRYRAGKFLARNRLGVAAGALVLAALVAGLIVSVWQAKIALHERDRAHLAQRQAERLNGFLEKLLGSADPTRMGKDVKVVAVLDAAGEKLDRELADEPEVLAAAHATLYRSYLHLGLWVPAEQQARAALVLQHRLHGPDDPAVVNGEVDLAVVLTHRNRSDEAATLLGHALEVLRRQPTPDHAALAMALQTLGTGLAGRGQTVQAEPVLLEALTHARAAGGEESSGYADTLNDLGNLKHGEKDYAAAEPIYRQVLALQDRLAPGGEHSIVPLVNLCIMLCYLENWDDMKRMVDRLERDARRLYGEKSVYYAIGIYGHGVVDTVEGHYQTAIPRFREALPLFAATFATGTNTLVQCQVQLGLSLTRTGRAAEGEPLLRAALADGGKIDRAEFAHTFGSVEAALGECLLAQKRYAEAERVLLAGHDDLEKRLGPQNRFTLEADRRLHELHSVWDKRAEAAPSAGETPSSRRDSGD